MYSIIKKNRNQNVFFTYLLFLSYFLTSLNIDIGFYLKPYMIISFLLFMLNLIKFKILRLELNEQLMLVFYFYYFFTIIFSEYKTVSIRLVFAIFINIFCYYIIRYFLTTINKNKLKDIIYSVGYFYNIVSFVLYILGVLYSQFSSLPYGVYYGTLVDGNMLRLVGLQGDPNLFVFSNFIFLYFYATNLKFKKSNWAFLLSLTNILLTISRSGYLVTGVVLLMYLIFSSRKMLNQLIFVFLIGVISIYLYSNFINFDLIMLIESRLGVNSNIDITGGRFNLFSIGLDIFSTRPLFGSGIFTSSILVGKMTGVEQFIHNTYLDILIEGGLVGLVLFITFLSSVFGTAIKHINKDDEDYFIIYTLLSQLLMMLTLSVPTNEFLFLTIVLTNIIVKNKKLEKEIFK